MSFLITLVLVGLLIWALNRDPLAQPRTKAKIYQINQQWVDFVAGYYRVINNDAEKSAVLRMLEDLQRQGMPNPTVPVIPTPSAAGLPYAPPQAEAVATAEPAKQVAAAPVYAPPATTHSVADNASILLYFGAFLLVAAAGLFVAFGGASGGVRTFIVAIVAAMLYCGGFWLWYAKPKLKQAALAFIGTGIVLVPLAGLAAYSYVFRSNGEAVWLVTSLVCLGVYGHALWAIKNPLLEYVLIGTFVSLFESAVAIAHAPSYYFGWGLAAVGLLVQAEQLIRRGRPEYDRPSTISASILLPLSILVAFVMVPSHGTTQLGVSLLLASLYYSLLAWRSDGDTRINGFVAAHVLTLAALAIFAYGMHHVLLHAALALVVLAIPQLVWVMVQKGQIIQNGASIMLASLVFAVLFAGESPKATLLAALTLALASAIVWLRQSRSGAYPLGIAALILVSLLLGYRLIDLGQSSRLAGLLLLVLAALQLGVFYWVRNSVRDTHGWRLGFQIIYIVVLVLTLGIAFAVSPLMLIVLAGSSAALIAPLIAYDNRPLWSTLSGIAIALPILGTYHKPALFLAAALLALAWNTTLSWWLTTEHNRAFSVVTWLLLPLALAHALPATPIEGYYAVAFSVVTVVLLGLRALVIWHTRKIIHTPAKQADSYTAGYLFSSMAAIIASGTGPRFLPAVICAGIALVMYVASVYVEKQAVLVAALPVLAQIGLWATFQHGQMVLYLILSTVLAALGYGYYAIAARSATGTRGYYVQLMSLFALFVPATLYLGGTVWWPMPWAFLVAGLAVLHYVWSRSQSSRELAGGLVLLAVFAGMHFYGVHNVQAYAHVAAALAAGYAYWRARRNEMTASDQYIVTTLAIITVPLVIQALVGTAGDLYGWWLLIEQIVIMLLGMVLSKKLMIRWGLFVALGSVLYQLRNLGWAALAVVAVFLIGLGVYYLQRQEKHGNK